MSEGPIDNAVDSTLNKEDELDTLEECPAVGLESLHQGDAPTLQGDELDATVKLPALRLQMQQRANVLQEDELDAATVKLPATWLLQTRPLPLPAIWLLQTRPLPLQPPDTPVLREAGPVTVKTFLYEWIKTNRVMLMNAGSLVLEQW